MRLEILQDDDSHTSATMECHANHYNANSSMSNGDTTQVEHKNIQITPASHGNEKRCSFFQSQVNQLPPCLSL